MTRKAQASFEFLATYGWVLVGILGAVGILFYMKVFDPLRYLPEECEFGQNIRCEDFSIRRVASESFNVSFKLKNNLEKSIDLVNASIYDSDNVRLVCPVIELYCPFTSVLTNWTNAAPGTFLGRWGVGKSCKLHANCDKFLVADRKSEIHAEIVFRRQTASNEATNHTIYGKLFANVP